MKRDHQKIDRFVATSTACSAETLDVGQQVAEMSVDDAALAMLKGAEKIAGREMTMEERTDWLPQMAAMYEGIGAALRRLAAGPQLRLVPHPPPEPANED